MAITDIPILSMLRTRLQWSQQRQAVLAENVANADTPSYRSRDLAPLKFQAPAAIDGGCIDHSQPRLSATRASAEPIGTEAAYKPGGQTDEREHHQKCDEKPRSQRHLRAKQGLEHQCTPNQVRRLIGRESPNWLIP